MTKRPEILPIHAEAISLSLPRITGNAMSVLGVGWDSVAILADVDWVFKFPKSADAEPA